MTEKSVSRFLLFVSPFFFPLYLLRFTVAGIPLTALEVFTYALFGVWFFEVALNQLRVNVSPRHLLYLLAAILLWAGAAIGLVKAPDIVALGVFKGWIVAPILYFIVLSQTLQTRAEVRQIIRNFVGSAILLSLASFAWAYVGPGLTYDNRLAGFFESANYLSLYLTPAVLMSVYFVIHQKFPPALINYLDVAGLAVLVTALFFTQSYAAVLAVFGALMLYAVYYFVNRYKSVKKADILFLIFFHFIF